MSNDFLLKNKGENYHIAVSFKLDIDE